MITRGMKNFILFLPVAVLFTACNSCGAKFSRQQQLQVQIDSMQEQIKKLEEKNAIVAIDTTRKKIETVSTATAETKVKVAPLTKPAPSTPTVTKPGILPGEKYPESKTDTTKYFYSNNKLSVKVSPWVNGRRKTWLYDYSGGLTYEQEEARLSFHITATLHFRKDGSVEKMEIHNNPGASMYWYETVITFGTTNEPQWKTETRYPIQTLDDAGKSFYWDKNGKKWIAQDIVEEKPYKP